jgi:hypothetical protein
LGDKRESGKRNKEKREVVVFHKKIILFTASYNLSRARENKSREVLDKLQETLFSPIFISLIYK